MSTPQPGRIVADCAQDVQAFLAQLGISRAATWGSSVGGAYALATAALLPQAMPRARGAPGRRAEPRMRGAPGRRVEPGGTAPGRTAPGRTAPEPAA